VVHSWPHEVWALEKSPRHGVGNDPTYNHGDCFKTFPFPWPLCEEPGEGEDPRVEQVAAASRTLVEQRDRWLNAEDLPEDELNMRTLTNLYNVRPKWLELAHARLDRAVFGAYGWPEDIADEEILKNLLALNLERSNPR
jgi:hypothetical protein